MSQFLKTLTKPTDPFYVRYIKGSDNTLPEFSGKNATFDGGGTLGGLITSNSTNPLKDIRDYKYTSGVSSQYDYFGYVFDVPLSLRGNTAMLEYLFKSSNNTSFNIVAKDVTNNTIIQTTVIPAQNGSSPQFQFLFNVPSTCTQVKIGIQYTGTASDVTFEYDNLVFGLWTPNVANLNIQEAISFTGYTSDDASNFLKLKTLESRVKYGSLITYTNSTQTRYTVLSQCLVTLSGTVYSSSNGNGQIFHFDSSGSEIKHTVDDGTNTGAPSLTVLANVGDYFLLGTGSTTTPIDAIYTNFSITAQATSEHIVQSYQDGMAGWTSYTPTFQGFGTVTDVNMTWIKDNESIKIRGTFKAGVNTPTEARIGLPNGLISQIQTATTTITGQITTSYLAATSFHGLLESQKSYFGVGKYDGSNNGLTKQNGNTFGDNATVSVNITIPIQGWSAAPTLLALPNGVETNYTIEASGNAGQSLTSGNTDIPFILVSQNNLSWDGSKLLSPSDSYYQIEGAIDLTGSSSGTYLNTYINGVNNKRIKYFTGQWTNFSSIVYVPANQTFSIRMVGDNKTLSNTSNHWIKITRLNGKIDKTFVGNVAKNQVATLYANPATVASIAGSFVDLTFDGVLGDTDIVKHTAGQANFTLEKGEYLLESESQVYKTNACYQSLYNVTNSSSIEDSTGFHSGSVDEEVINFGGKFSKLVVNQTTVFKIRMYAAAANSSGFGNSSWAGKRAKLQITKLLGN